MDYFNAFWFGGLICALIQILLDKTKLMPGRVMVLLVCSGAVLSAVGIYKPLVDFAGAGASVPLIGFGHVLWEGMKKAIEEDGILGLFTGGFTACAAGHRSHKSPCIPSGHCRPFHEQSQNPQPAPGHAGNSSGRNKARTLCHVRVRSSEKDPEAGTLC